MLKILKMNYRDKRKNILTILVLLVPSLFIIVSFYMQFYYQNLIEEMANQNDDNKTLIIFKSPSLSQDDYDFLKQVDHVVNSYINYGNYSLDCLYSYNDIATLEGYTLNADDEIVISSSFAENNDYEVGDKIYILDKYEATIIGISPKGTSDIYVTTNVLGEIASYYNATIVYITIILNDYQYVEEIANYLEELNYSPTASITIEAKIANLESLIEKMNYMIYIVIVFSIIIIFNVYRYLVKEEVKNNALLKLLGYRSIAVSFINISYLFILSFLTILLEIILYFPIKIVMDIMKIYTLPYFDYLSIIWFIILIYFVVIIIYFTINFTKIKKIDMLEEIESNCL